jgi:hypothetical protein
MTTTVTVKTSDYEVYVRTNTDNTITVPSNTTKEFTVYGIGFLTISEQAHTPLIQW